MIRLARAQPGIAVLSFDLRCATPILPVATGRHVSSSPRSLPKQAFNATRQQTVSTEIPIASDARPFHTSRGLLHWRFAYAGPRCARHHHHGAGIRKPSQSLPKHVVRVTSAFHPNSDHVWDASARSKSAISGLLQCSRSYPIQPTSVAVASSVCGMVSPKLSAVLRFAVGA
jgi:hypothetical protein